MACLVEPFTMNEFTVIDATFTREYTNTHAHVRYNGTGI